MQEDPKPERELERLQSMHQTVEKLRAQLKTLEVTSKNVARAYEDERQGSD